MSTFLEDLMTYERAGKLEVLLNQTCEDPTRSYGRGEVLCGDRYFPTVKGNSNPRGARPVHRIISMIKWIRTSWLSIKKSLLD